MRLIEFFNVSTYRLKEFFLYTVCGIEFYRNYQRFYWGPIYNKTKESYSKEDVIKIVEKSRETGLTAEYLLLTLNNKNKSIKNKG